MSWEKLTSWVKAHPWEAGLISLGLLVLLLWLFGFFGRGSSSDSSSGGQNLAAAYYAAEAAQTTAATQLQMATVAYGNQTAQEQIRATAAEGIAATQAGMYTTLGQQGSDTQIALSHDNLLATNHSNDDALAATVVTAGDNAQTAQAGFLAQNFQTLLSTVVPSELARYGGQANFVSPALPGGGLNVNLGGVWDVNGLIASGYTPQQALNIASGRAPA